MCTWEIKQQVEHYQKTCFQWIRQGCKFPFNSTKRITYFFFVVQCTHTNSVLLLLLMWYRYFWCIVKDTYGAGEFKKTTECIITDLYQRIETCLLQTIVRIHKSCNVVATPLWIFWRWKSASKEFDTLKIPINTMKKINTHMFLFSHIQNIHINIQDVWLSCVFMKNYLHEEYLGFPYFYFFVKVPNSRSRKYFFNNFCFLLNIYN